jgi:hypothetical protein
VVDGAQRQSGGTLPDPGKSPPWWGTGGDDAGSPPSTDADRALAVENVLGAVERVRSWIPTWRRTVNAVLQATVPEASEAVLARALKAAVDARSAESPWSPAQACNLFVARDQVSGPYVARELVGEQAELLVVDLREADAAWPSVCLADGKLDRVVIAAAATHSLAALQSTLQHALMLTFLHDCAKKAVGNNVAFDDYCDGWELTPAQVATTWLWLTHDPWLFGGQPLLLVPESGTGHRVYRKARTWSLPWFVTTLAPLWGAVLVWALTAGLFALLHRAGLTRWPHHWQVQLVVLVLFVALGALAHVASRSLSAISYEDPLQVYAAGKALDWLSLRWLGVLRAYIPILVVGISLWGAGTVPHHFQDLATALLAGYSADSLFRAGLSKLQTQSSAKPPGPAAAAKA